MDIQLDRFYDQSQQNTMGIAPEFKNPDVFHWIRNRYYLARMTMLMYVNSQDIEEWRGPFYKSYPTLRHEIVDVYDAYRGSYLNIHDIDPNGDEGALHDAEFYDARLSDIASDTDPYITDERHGLSRDQIRELREFVKNMARDLSVLYRLNETRRTASHALDLLHLSEPRSKYRKTS